MHAKAAGLAVLVALAAWPAKARAQDVPPARTSGVEWNEAWPKFRWWEWGVTAAGWSATIGSGYVLPDTPYGWRGINDFDETMRDGLRWSSANSRKTAAVVSDGLFYGLAAFPLVVDSLLVTWGVHGKPSVAFQLFMTDLEALGVAGFLSSVTERTGRERPYVRTCPSVRDVEPSREPSKTLSIEPPCDDTGRNQSFVSGHTAAAFAGAGLICVHHTSLPLFGSRAADVATCVVAMSGAVTAGYLRVAGDVHYTTDVLAAAGTGLASGLVLPYLLRFHGGSTAERRVSFAPLGGRDTIGIGVSGALP